MKNNIVEKLKSKVVWLTAIPLIVNLIAIFASQAYADQFGEVATMIVSLLAVFGILNNPNDKEGF